MFKILLIATGGTIASVETENGLVPAESAEHLIEYIPSIKGKCSIQSCQLFNIDSTNMNQSHWIKLTEKIRENYNSFDAFIITHGTDTMAYTAAVLSYLIQNPDKPVIITGSQKPISSSFTDARKNLIDSIDFARKSKLGGVFVVFGGIAILGTRARKVRSKSFSAFESINYPIAASIDDGRVFTYMTNDKSEPVKFYSDLSEGVFLLKLIPGIKPDILRYLGDHYSAIVIESYGVGGVPFSDKVNLLQELDSLTKKGKLIVLSTQVMHEGSDASTYEVGALAMKKYNVLQSYDMTIEATVTKLMWILSETTEFDTIQKMFYRKINSDILRTDDFTT